MDFAQGPAVPRAEVLDGSTLYNAPNPLGLMPVQIAAEYQAQNLDLVERAINVRVITEWSSGPWEQHTIHAPPPAPLEHLEWNQGGWPSWNGTDYVVVLDNGTYFHALNPEGWDFARAAQDYFESYACEIKEPHEVEIRAHTMSGAGPSQPIQIPVEP